jgi:hypothetical protein
MQRRILQLGGGLAVAAVFLSGAQAESSSPSDTAGRDPAGAQPAIVVEHAGSQALPGYRSALNEYRPYDLDEPLHSWKDANDEVGRLGGHMGHLMPSAEGGGR